MCEPKPLVPSSDEVPIMGLKTSKNFIVANAVENILAVPRNVDGESKLYVQKQDYGKVPDYLGKVKDAIATENEIMREYLQQETAPMAGEDSQGDLMSEEDRQELIHELKLKWDEVNKEYQKSAHNVKLDTINKLRKYVRKRS